MWSQFVERLKAVVPSTVRQWFERIELTRLTLMLLTTLWISLIPNLGTHEMFATSPDAGAGMKWLLFMFSGWAFTFTVVFVPLLLLSFLFWGRAVKLLCVIALIAAAALGYYSFFLGVQFDRSMWLNMLQTHPSEALELFGWRVALWTLVLGVLPAVMVLMMRLQPTSFSVRSTMYFVLAPVACFAVTALSVLGNYQSFSSAARNRSISTHMMAPTNVVLASISHFQAHYSHDVVREPRALDAKVAYPLKKPRLIVFVLGETARAQNQSMNGYARPTNARMQAHGAIYYPDTIACGTSTALSVPCMFSDLTTVDFSLKKARSRETLIDVIARTGNTVIWRDNNGGCKDVCSKSQFLNLTNSDNPKWCSEKGNCLDEILLDGVEQELIQLRTQPNTRDVFLVLHLKGSHGPAYHKRYPKQFEQFTPVCQSNELSSCAIPSIVNAYDNTLMYTDYVLDQTVQMLLRQQDRYASAMMYVSDHGESLGENGLFLHGLPSTIAPKTQTRVPMMAWFSDRFLQLEGWSKSCLQTTNQTQRSHDNVYHTLLGLMEIATQDYQPQLDLFSSCDDDRRQVHKQH